MGFVDDILAVAKCGNPAVKANAIINSFIESKKLEFGQNKCHQLHVGEYTGICNF